MLTKRFTFWYRLALALVACLSFVGYLLVQRQLSGQQNDSALINDAGRQRFQSQLIVKDAILLTMVPTRADAQAVRAELTTVLTRWETYQTRLRMGMMPTSAVRIVNSDTVQALFNATQPHVGIISQQTHLLLTLAAPPGSQSQSRATTTAIDQILAHEKPYLELMDRLVNQCALESQQKVDCLVFTEWLLVGLTLLVLVLEAQFIFRPAVQALDHSVRQLNQAAVETQLANIALQGASEANQTLYETQDRLLRESALRHQQQLNEQIVRMAALMQGQEDERKRLSYDLHDGIGQMLTGQKLLVDQLRFVHLLPEKEQRAHASLKGLIVRTIQEVRNVSNSLMPPVLSDFGLEPGRVRCLCFV